MVGKQEVPCSTGNFGLNIEIGESRVNLMCSGADPASGVFIGPEWELTIRGPELTPHNRCGDLPLHDDFLKSACVQNTNSPTAASYESEVVGNEYKSDAIDRTHAVKKIHKSQTCRKIEGTGRFVGHDDPGTSCQSSGDHDPLTLATAQCVRTAITHLEGETHVMEQRSGTPIGVVDPGCYGGVTNTAADTAPWVKSGGGILKDHLYRARPSFPAG